MLETVTDEQLMTAYYRGENAAFDELYRRYHTRLYHFARQRLSPTTPGRDDTAEEIVAEVWVRKCATRDRLSSRWDPEKGSIATFFYRNVLYRVIDHRRKSATLPEELMTDLEPDDDVAAPDETLREQKIHRSAAPDMFDPASRLFMMEVRDCKQRLQEPFHTVILLYYDAEVNLREIGAILGKSEGWASKVCKQARALLLNCLAEKDLVNNRA